MNVRSLHWTLLFIVICKQFLRRVGVLYRRALSFRLLLLKCASCSVLFYQKKPSSVWVFNCGICFIYKIYSYVYLNLNSTRIICGWWYCRDKVMRHLKISLIIPCHCHRNKMRPVIQGDRGGLLALLLNSV
jgi:hypothetical protein